MSMGAHSANCERVVAFPADPADRRGLHSAGTGRFTVLMPDLKGRALAWLARTVERNVVQEASSFEYSDFEARFDGLFEVAMRPSLRILHSVESAEDVAAEVLARLYVDWARLGAQPWVDAWIVRTATNLSIDHIRRAKRVAPRVTTTPAGEIELRLDLVHAVARLPRRQRESVALRYFGDLPEQEVAALLGISVGSVKTHVHRAMNALRVELSDTWGGSLDS